MSLYPWISSSFDHLKLSEILFSLSVLILLYVICVCIKRIWFHPLSKYPGPFLAKITSARGAFYGALGDHHLDVTRLHHKYGTYVRYGPNRLLVKSVQGMKDIYGFGKPLCKAQAYAPMLQGKDGYSTPTSIDKKMHRMMRDELMRGLSPEGIRSFEPRVLDKIDKFISLLREDSKEGHENCWTAAKDMNAHNRWLAFDIIAAISFAEKDGMLDKPKIRSLSNVFERCTSIIAFYIHWPELNKLNLTNVLGILPGSSKSLKKYRAWHASIARTVLSEDEDAGGGIFASISKHRSQDYSDSQLVAEATNFMIVGSDTTAATLSAFTFYLSRSPHVYARLADEIRAKFSSYDSISSMMNLSSCVYLQACIYETLRIAPAGPGTLWREVDAEYTTIDGEILPKGVDVGTCIFSMHRDPVLFRDESGFWPERWLPGNLPSEELATAKAAFKPFLLGPRSCAGRAIAMMVISLTVARLIYATDFKVPEGELGCIGQGHPGSRRGRTNVDEFQIEDRFTAACHGPYLQFKRRR